MRACTLTASQPKHLFAKACEACHCLVLPICESSIWRSFSSDIFVRACLCVCGPRIVGLQLCCQAVHYAECAPSLGSSAHMQQEVASCHDVALGIRIHDMQIISSFSTI